jgi:hypothetical protein
MNDMLEEKKEHINCHGKLIDTGRIIYRDSIFSI